MEWNDRTIIAGFPHIFRLQVRLAIRKSWKWKRREKAQNSPTVSDEQNFDRMMDKKKGTYATIHLAPHQSSLCDDDELSEP